MIVELITEFDENHGLDIERLEKFPENGRSLSGNKYGSKHLIRCLRSVGIDAYIKDDKINEPDNEVPYYTKSRNPDFVIVHRVPWLCTDENYIFYSRNAPFGAPNGEEEFPVRPKNFVFLSERVRRSWAHDPDAYSGPVMYNPMDLDYFTPYNENGEYEKDPNLICAASTINKIKRIGDMCDIVIRVKEQNPKIVFKFFGCLEMWGDGKFQDDAFGIHDAYDIRDHESYERLLKCADHVGWVSHEILKDELKKCTYFLHTSESEQWGQSVQESVSSGCIAITTRLASLHEQIDHDWMFKIGDVDGFVDAIDFLFKPEQLEYRTLLMLEARNKAETMWSYEVIGERWKSYLEGI